MMGNKFSTFINDFYFWELIPGTLPGISEDCISNSQISNKRRKGVKNGEDHGALSLLFAISGYKFIGKDRNKFGDGIVFCIHDQLPSRTIKIKNPSDIWILTIDITVRKNEILPILQLVLKPL